MLCVASPLVWAEGDLLALAAEPQGDGWWWKVWRTGAVSVLVVSENPSWRDEVARLLDTEGYAVRLDDCGDAALEVGCPFDIALVDLAITGRSPVVVFAALRARSAIPILAVSLEGSRAPAALDAYAAGADQLVSHGQRPRELMARVRALLRRSPPHPRGSRVPLDAGSISLDPGRGVVSVAGTEVMFTAREGQILRALLERPGRVVTRDQLVGLGRGQEDARLLDSHVRSVRTKLEAAEGRRRIIAVRGVGFRLLPDGELDP